MSGPDTHLGPAESERELVVVPKWEPIQVRDEDDQLAIDEEIEDFGEWVSSLPR